MRSALSSETENEDVAVRRQLLELALRNSARSAPLLLLMAMVIVWWGVEAGCERAAVATGVIGTAAALWRFFLSHRHTASAAADSRAFTRVIREVFVESLG